MTREFLTARGAADLLGCDEAAVVSDIKRGFDKVDALIGGRFGEVWIVYSWQLQGEHLERHQARLAPRENDAHG